MRYLVPIQNPHNNYNASNNQNYSSSYTSLSSSINLSTFTARQEPLSSTPSPQTSPYTSKTRRHSLATDSPVLSGLKRERYQGEVELFEVENVNSSPFSTYSAFSHHNQQQIQQENCRKKFATDSFQVDIDEDDSFDDFDGADLVRRIHATSISSPNNRSDFALTTPWNSPSYDY